MSQKNGSNFMLKVLIVIAWGHISNVSYVSSYCHNRG